MKSFPTPLFSHFIVKDIKAHLTEANSYLVLGTSKDFGATESDVENISYTTNKINEFYYNILGYKRIFQSDIQLVIPRVDYTTNLVYDTYEDHIDIHSYVDYSYLGVANANANTVLLGSANIYANTTVTGLGATAFNTYIFPGDKILVNSQIKTVVSVTNSDHLIVNSAFSNTNVSGQIVLLQNSRTIIGGSNAEFIGNVTTGNVVVVGEQALEVVSVLSNKVISLNANLTYSNTNTAISRKDNTYPYTANTFYVRNNRDQVFKCLFNGNNSPSTVEPTIDIDGQLPENAFIVTSDGYKWKYMYTIPPGLKQKFFTSKWMPVVSDQTVVGSAVEGRVDVVNVLWGGSGHLAGGNSNVATILTITNTDGQNANLAARVVNGNITSVTVLTGGNNYTRGTVTVNDPDKLGTNTLTGRFDTSGGALVTANLNSNTYFVGNVFVNDIITMNGISRNVVSVTNSSHLIVNTPFYYAASNQVATITRSNAIFDIQIGPQNGHGYDPEKELRCHTLMVSVELEGTENGTIPISDSTNQFDFNQVGIILEPLVANGAYSANLTNYRGSTRLLVSDPVTADFIDDETVFVGSSLSVANAVANVSHWDTGNNYLYINNITGTFSVSDSLKSEDSGISVPILEVSGSQIKPFSGDLIYMENRTNVVRKDAQIDQVKIVLSF
jgi:hypothetical protein